MCLHGGCLTTGSQLSPFATASVRALLFTVTAEAHFIGCVSKRGTRQNNPHALLVMRGFQVGGKRAALLYPALLLSFLNTKVPSQKSQPVLSSCGGFS